MFRSIQSIKNDRVTFIVYRVAYLTLAFFIARIVASVIDNYTGYGIGWFSNIANFLFWGIIYYRCRQIRISLQSDDFPVESKQSISRALDEIIDEMSRTSRKIAKLT